MPFDAAPRTRLDHSARALDALALAAQKKEPGADDALVEALLVRLRPLVAWRMLARSGGALAQADVDDVLQEVVLLVWQRDVAVFDPSKSGFLTFVTRRLGWHIADCARNARRRAALEGGEIPEEDDAGVDLEDEGRDPEALLEAARSERALLALEGRIAEAGVDEAARHVIVRHDLQGATLTEIAKEMGRNVSNACRARQRGLDRLARHFEALAA
jgi:RNA polymerase sigma factor (sigma-70 family)